MSTIRHVDKLLRVIAPKREIDFDLVRESLNQVKIEDVPALLLDMLFIKDRNGNPVSDVESLRNRLMNIGLGGLEILFQAASIAKTVVEERQVQEQEEQRTVSRKRPRSVRVRRTTQEVQINDEEIEDESPPKRRRERMPDPEPRARPTLSRLSLPRSQEPIIPETPTLVPMTPATPLQDQEPDPVLSPLSSPRAAQQLLNLNPPGPTTTARPVNQQPVTRPEVIELDAETLDADPVPPNSIPELIQSCKRLLAFQKRIHSQARHDELQSLLGQLKEKIREFMTDNRDRRAPPTPLGDDEASTPETIVQDFISLYQKLGGLKSWTQTEQLKYYLRLGSRVFQLFDIYSRETGDFHVGGRGLRGYIERRTGIQGVPIKALATMYKYLTPYRTLCTYPLKKSWIWGDNAKVLNLALQDDPTMR
jgi:DNA-binding protein H-NS